MQISVETRTRGHAAWQRIVDSGGRVTVLLDGVQQLHCLMADEKAGQVKRFVTDGNGRLIEDEKTGDVATELVSGTVEIQISGASAG